MKHIGAISVCFLAPALALAAAAQANETAWWSQVPGIPALGRAGAPASPEWIMPSGVVACVSGGEKGIRISRANPLGADQEVEIAFKLDPPQGKSSSVELRIAGQAAANAPKSVLAAWVRFTGGKNDCEWRVTASTNRAVMNNGTLIMLNSSMRQLDWPENLRRIVEGEAASLTPLNQRWHRLRVQLRKDSFRVYLNDMLVSDKSAADSPAGGEVFVEVGAYAELASAVTRPLPPDDPLFWPVTLGDRLNARAIGKAFVQDASLPPPDSVVKVAGVPFIFPHPNSKGQNHVDLGASWMQGANLTGWLSSGWGAFGGRFFGALLENPARIQFRVPTARYQAVHLIAAFDGEPDKTPVVSAQFYKPGAGLPESFSTSAPLFTEKASSVTPLPVSLENGGNGNLYLVTIPIEPGKLAGFQHLDIMEVELTKQVQLYRSYPDPICYSAHGAGLPSGVHVFAMTLERPALDYEIEPGNFAYAWTDPEQPTVTVHLKNRTNKPQNAELTFSAESHDGSDRIKETKKASVAANGGADVRFDLPLKRFGHYSASFAMKIGATQLNEPLGLARLHKDTRERGNWEKGRGQLFGCWLEQGGHDSPSLEQELQVMGPAGMEGLFARITTNHPASLQALAKKYGMINISRANGIRITGAFRSALAQGKPESEALAEMMEKLKSNSVNPDKLDKPIKISFYAEPSLGASTYGTRADYMGDTSVTQMTPELVKSAQIAGRAFAIGAKAIKKEWPGTLTLMPHGDIMFAVTVLEYSPEAREEFDGLSDDMHGGDRLPEQPIHQCAIHRHIMRKQELARMGITNMFITVEEGPYIPAREGSLTLREQADLLLRSQLVLMGYGATAHLGGWRTFAVGSSYGENYSGADGQFERKPICAPRPSYAAYATMTRHLNRMNFDDWLPTGSLSVYAMRFKHWKTGASKLVLWTVRGTRPVSFLAAGKGPVIVYDMMDNAQTLQPDKEGKVAFVLSSSPVFVDGAAPDTAFVLGEPDQSDGNPTAPFALTLGELGDGTWSVSTNRDLDYEGSQSDFVRRIPGNMTAHPEEAPQGKGKALAIELAQQAETNFYMPFYTTLLPKKSLMIPGKATHLGLWARAASDWGRVVYALRDAKGERWLSVGTKGAWNCDDMGNWSSFCFDGWRYLRFELPAHAPYDVYRENGTTWWGSYGQGDGIVDLPLTIEKIFVERRTHVVYVNDVQPANPEPVLLAGLSAEYNDQKESTEEAVRISRLRMPVPKGVPDLDNPIARLRTVGVGQAPAITDASLPDQDVSGKMCHVHFPEAPEAKCYEIWVSPYPDGRGAIKMTGDKGWDKPGNLLRGLQPDTDFYLFLVVVDKNGTPSKPSPAFKVRFKNMFYQGYV